MESDPTTVSGVRKVLPGQSFIRRIPALPLKSTRLSNLHSLASATELDISNILLLGKFTMPKFYYFSVNRNFVEIYS